MQHTRTSKESLILQFAPPPPFKTPGARQNNKLPQMNKLRRAHRWSLQQTKDPDRLVRWGSWSIPTGLNPPGTVSSGDTTAASWREKESEADISQSTILDRVWKLSQSRSTGWLLKNNLNNRRPKVPVIAKSHCTVLFGLEVNKLALSSPTCLVNTGTRPNLIEGAY